MKPIARLGGLSLLPKKRLRNHSHRYCSFDLRLWWNIDCDSTACDAVIIQGLSKMDIDGRPVAYVGSKTSHDGTIITRSDDFLVDP